MPLHTCPCGFEPKSRRKDHLKQHQNGCDAHTKIVELQEENKKMQSQLLKLTEIALTSNAPDSSRCELLEVSNSQKNDLLAKKEKMLTEKEREIEALKREVTELKTSLKRARKSTGSIMANAVVEVSTFSADCFPFELVGGSSSDDTCMAIRFDDESQSEYPFVFRSSMRGITTDDIEVLKEWMDVADTSNIYYFDCNGDKQPLDLLTNYTFPKPLQMANSEKKQE